MHEGGVGVALFVRAFSRVMISCVRTTAAIAAKRATCAPFVRMLRAVTVKDSASSEESESQVTSVGFCSSGWPQGLFFGAMVTQENKG